MRHIFSFSAICSCVLLLISSCTSTKTTTYFQDIPDSLYKAAETIPVSGYTDPLIQPNDILQISVQTIDPQSTLSMGTQATATQSVQGGSAVGVAPSQGIQGYLVDKNGNVELPLVGKIKVGGLSTEQAREAIRQKVTIYYKEPVVNVRLANFYISIFGEVARPSQYIIPSEKATILDAIAMAGDLTIYGKRSNVMLIRDENGVKKTMRFDLRSKDIFQSPYFYLRQGDVVYVEANKAKVAANDLVTLRNASIITSIASLLIILVSRLNF